MGISVLSPAAPQGLSGSTPIDVVTTAAAVGVSNQAARGDHTHKLQDSGWIVPTFLNGWINYGGVYSTARYRKIGGIVILTGLVKSGTVGANIFVLPAGYRPLNNLHISVPSNGVHGILEVFPDGSAKANTGSNIWFSIECSFAAEL